MWLVKLVVESNNVVGEDLANAAVSYGVEQGPTIPSHIHQTFVINNTPYHCHFTELLDLDYNSTGPVSCDKYISMHGHSRSKDEFRESKLDHIYVSR